MCDGGGGAQTRENFWSEFEFYFSDLTVGLVLDVLLVGLMATPAVIGKHHAAHGATGRGGAPISCSWGKAQIYWQ